LTCLSNSEELVRYDSRERANPSSIHPELNQSDTMEVDQVRALPIYL
jgi:hypothetical protein